MSKIKYSPSQIQELGANKYVKKVTAKYLCFSYECKVEFLKLSASGMFYRDIFRKLGFPEYVVLSDTPKQCFQRWKHNQKHGIVEKKKGRKKIELDPKKMSKDEYIEYLETENAVLKELKNLLDGGYP